jgi:hypothetical protein
VVISEEGCFAAAFERGGEGKLEQLRPPYAAAGYAGETAAGLSTTAAGMVKKKVLPR